MNIRLILTLVAMTAAIFAGGTHAKTDEREKVEILYETTLNLIQLLVEQGVIKQEVADEMIKKAEQKAKASRLQAEAKTPQPEAGEPKKGEVRVTYVPEHIKKEIRDQLREEVVGQAVNLRTPGFTRRANALNEQHRRPLAGQFVVKVHIRLFCQSHARMFHDLRETGKSRLLCSAMESP